MCANIGTYSGIVIDVDYFHHTGRFVLYFCTVVVSFYHRCTYLRAYSCSTVGCTVVVQCHLGHTYVCIL